MGRGDIMEVVGEMVGEVHEVNNHADTATAAEKILLNQYLPIFLNGLPSYEQDTNELESETKVY